MAKPQVPPDFNTEPVTTLEGGQLHTGPIIRLILSSHINSAPC